MGSCYNAVNAEAAEDPTVSPDERARGLAMADKLPMRVLTRLWQMLLKTLDEVASALGISKATVDRDMRLARAWLRDALRSGAGSPEA